MLKKITKNIIGQAFSKFNYPMVVNSYGRSGSTVLTKSIINSSIQTKNVTIRNIAYRAISQSAWDLNNTNLKNGIVYKTHDYPPSIYQNSNLKMLYTFADPVDVVLSLLRLFEEKGEEWMKLHYKHLGVSYTNSFDQIIYEDQLQLEKHLDSWLNEARIRVAFVRYEKMWDHQDEISDYLGFHIELPEFRERKASKENDFENIETIESSYKSLREKISKLDNFFITN